MVDAADTSDKATTSNVLTPLGKAPLPPINVPGHSTPNAQATVATTLEVTLSDTLQTTLGQPGVNAYAVYFNANVGGGPMWTDLVADGAVSNAGVTEIPLTDTVNGVLQPLIGGKVYFLVQSAGADSADLTDVITQESDINWGNAQANDYRYDSFEVTLQGSPNDVGNLTSVNGFGLPMELKVDYTDGSSSKGYSIPAETLFDQLDDAASGSVHTYSDGPLKGDDRAAVSPTTSIAGDFDNYQASDWTQYLNDLKSGEDDIAISGFFNGAPDANGVWHNGAFYAYELEWDAKGEAFWLRAQDNSVVKGDIRLTEDDLANSIYSTLGNVGIYAPGSDKPYQIYNHGNVENSDGVAATMNTGENNQWGAVLEQFLTGFTAGYYGVKGQSLNSLDTDPVDLSQNWNWDPTYAFGDNMAADPSANDPDATYKPVAFDKYSKVFFDISNSYGSGYSDGLMAQYDQGDPLISVSEPGTNKNVPKISLTIYDDSETPEGYVKPEINNYIAPATGGYVTAPPGTTNTSGASVGLNLANAGMVLKDDTPITLDFLVSGDGSKDADWQSVTIAPDADTSLWQNWQIKIDANGDYQAEASGTDTPPGSLLITNFPGMDAGIHWSRITIGSGDASKTYNLYTTTDGTNFQNPAYDGQAGALAIDGLATISPQASSSADIPTFTINFLRSSSSSLPSELLTTNTAQESTLTPTAPVVGTLDGDTFTALPGQNDKINTSATATNAEVSFGWTGLNNSQSAAAALPEWIKTYTNKIGALNVAQISLVEGKGAIMPFVASQSDVDGQWMTEAKALGNGTYTVTMAEFPPGTVEMIAIGQRSSALTLTVDVAEKVLALAQGGQALKIDNSGGQQVDGNWVRVQSAEAAQAAGAAVAMVLTDASGALIHAKTGETGGVSVEDATVQTLGALALPDGSPAIHGTQSFYLPSEARLGFVSLDADGEARDDVAAVTRDEDGGATVEIGGHVLEVDVDNTLSDAAVLADAQRETGEPFVFVRTGQKVHVDLAGDAEGGNRLGFVNVDIDDTGGWSVDGVDHDEAGFDAALRANLDGGFSMHGAGSFRGADIWTVAGETGFYAPVVLTEAGEVIFAPTGNGDVGDGDSMRLLGQNFFAFEDGAGSRDFDDITARLTPVTEGTTGRLSGVTTAPLVATTAASVRSGDRFVSDLPAAGGAGFGLTVLPSETGQSRLLVNGEATFNGAGGVRMEGPDPVVVIGEAGTLALPGGGTVLDLRDGAGVLVNNGLIRGDIGFGAGDDVVRGAGRYDGEIEMRQGNDTFTGGAGDDVVHGGAGADALHGADGADTLHGGTGADLLVGGRGDDVLLGGPGFDTLLGGAGNDELRGGRGADVLNGGSGDDMLFGGDGSDVLDGGNGDDLLMGGVGADVLIGGMGDDTIYGGPGDDVMRGEQGADYLLGGRGMDILMGGRGDDVLRGGRGADTLSGGAGDDVLIGGPGDDLLVGGNGDDVLSGGPGDDVLIGGRGTDVFVLQMRNGNDRIGDFEVNRDGVDLTDYGLDPATGDAQVIAAMEELPSGSTLLDLSELGGTGSVRFNGLDLDEASGIVFLF